MPDTSYDVVINYITKGDVGGKDASTKFRAKKVSDADWALNFDRQMSLKKGDAEWAQTRANIRQEGAARRKAEADHMAYRTSLNQRFGASAASALTGAGRGLSGAADFATSLVGKAATAAFWGDLGLMAGLSFGIEFNNELERTQIGLAGIFQAAGIGDFNSDMGMTAQLLKTMQKDAAILPGTFRELVQTFQAIATPALQTGMSVNQTEKFAANTLAIGVTNQLAPRVAAREMRAMLQGQVHSQNILAQMMLPQMGLGIKEFNKLDPKQRLEKINGVFGKYADSFKAYENSFVGLGTSTLSNLQILLGKVTKPLFEDVKHTLKSFNDWMTVNSQGIDQWADRVGEKLHNAFVKVRDIIQSLIPLIARLSGQAESFFNKGGLHKMMVGGEVIAGAKLAGAGLQAVGGLEGVGGVAGAMAFLEGAILPLGAVALTAAGAVKALGDNDYIFHKQAVDAWLDIQKTGTEVLYGLRNDWDNFLYNTLPLLTFGLENLGLAGLGAAEVVVNLAGGFKVLAASMLDAIPVIGPLLDLALRDWGGGSLGHAVRPGRRGEITGGNFNEFEGMMAEERRPIVQNHNTHIGSVNINLAVNEDPSRIAHQIKDVLVNMGRNPTTTRAIKNFSTPR